MKKILGLDVGGTKCSVILGETDSAQIKIIEKTMFPTETQKGFQQTMDHFYEGIDTILKKHSLASADVAAIGISCGGPLDSARGVVMSPPNLPGWDNIPVVDLLNKKYGINTFLQNDANACALAEWKYGSGKGTRNMIFMTFGTGLGAGLILDGKLYSGTNDMAGEVGHIRLSDNGPVGYGKSGSFEGFCSGGGIAQIARTKVLEKIQSGVEVSFCKTTDELDTLTTQKIADAALKGDKLALDIFKISGTYLGKGLSVLIDILNPEVIVIGSIFTRVQQLLEPFAMEVILKETISHSNRVCKLKPASLGESIGDIAALSVAAYNL
jgi:glucokinase